MTELTDFERRVLTDFRNGFNSMEIAEEENCDEATVARALYHARCKVYGYNLPPRRVEAAA